MGYSEKTPTGRWKGTYRSLNGKERSKTFDRKIDADRFWQSAETDKARGQWIDPSLGRTTFAEVADRWMTSNPGKRATTLARDETVLRVHFLPLLRNVKVGELRPSHLKSCVDAMSAKGLAPKTIRTNFGVVRAVLSWAVDDDVIPRSPCRGVRLPEVRGSAKRVATATEIRHLADEMPSDYRVAVFLGALGLRLAEVVGLRVGTIDFLRRTLIVSATINEVEGKFVAGGGKTEASVRTISLPNYALEELAAHLARVGRNSSDDLVLAAPNGGPMRASNFRTRVYNPALERAGLEGLTFHRLRHSAGALMREAGVPLEVIQRRLGHASIRTTADVYGSLPASVDRAVADQLDALFSEGSSAEDATSSG